ncbi:hypothetical protein CHELA20_50600 [Hyphomicrobiales bacterium]|nr:hypothetical protein CHELA20_50600 [Hyphomicrobiales bacterium]CAH1677639.1 hypothetical protein CHELA41_24422 [Hyphomicrobiales bacterium]
MSDKDERGRPCDGLAAGSMPMVMGMVERRMIQWAKRFGSGAGDRNAIVSTEIGLHASGSAYDHITVLACEAHRRRPFRRDRLGGRGSL